MCRQRLLATPNNDIAAERQVGCYLTQLVTHLVWPHWQETPTREALISHTFIHVQKIGLGLFVGEIPTIPSLFIKDLEITLPALEC